MAVLELAVIVVAFGAMGVVFGLQEWAEWRRILARAEAALERDRSSITLFLAEPAGDENDDVRHAA